MESPSTNILHAEAQSDKTASKLNQLRAAVLGANDGIVSVAAVIVGVAGASNTISFILISGVAALVAGALSMAAGEYVSVSSQRDAERALLEKERLELLHEPEAEFEELVSIYQGKGLTEKTARVVATELSDHDAFAAHVDAELHINPDNLTNPWHAAYASALAFVCGALIPLAAVFLAPAFIRVPATFISVILALCITGALSANAGGANKRKAILRVVVGGFLAMLITFAVGKIFGVAGI